MTILLVIGLATLRARICETPHRSRPHVAIAILSELALIAQFGTSMMDRQRLELRKTLMMPS